MNLESIGDLIRQLRTEKQMTQKELAGQLHLTEQAVSRWERGVGLPDVGTLPQLSRILGADLGSILQGDLEERQGKGGKMKNIHFYVCPSCQNLLFATSEAKISCCGRSLEKEVPREAQDAEKMRVEEVEDEWYITCEHPMTKSDYIAFSASLNYGKVEVFAHYPEWNYELRIPRTRGARFFWYSKKDGLKYQRI